jgi:hypothetical protein
VCAEQPDLARDETGEIRSDAGRYSIFRLTFSPMAPGPGRSAAPSMARFPVFGMQKTAARCALWTRPSVMFPGATPISRIARAVVFPNAPTFAWLGQKLPVELVAVTTPVVSGLIETPRVATN